MDNLILLAHVLGATVWVGGHLVLALSILPGALRERSVERLLWFEAAYERIGIPVLLIQVLSGLWLAYRLVPDPGRWLSFDMPVTQLLGVKLLLLATTLVFAVDARLRIIPQLTPERLGILAWHIVPVTIVSVAFVVTGLAFRTGWFV